MLTKERFKGTIKYLLTTNDFIRLCRFNFITLVLLILSIHFHHFGIPIFETIVAEIITIIFSVIRIIQLLGSYKENIFIESQLIYQASAWVILMMSIIAAYIVFVKLLFPIYNQTTDPYYADFWVWLAMLITGVIIIFDIVIRITPKVFHALEQDDEITKIKSPTIHMMKISVCGMIFLFCLMELAIPKTWMLVPR